MVFIVTPFEPPGVKVDWPLKVPVPETVKEPGIVVVPVAAPIEVAVEAPPMFKVVAVVLNRLAVVFSETRSELEGPEILIPFEAVRI